MKLIRKHTHERGRTPTRGAPLDEFQLPSRDSRTRKSRQELLQQAVNHRTSLTRSLTQAPHQRQRDLNYTHRPEFKRWSSYDLPPTSTPSKEISPFTMLDDQYNTKHPVASSINLSTDNSFKELEKLTPQQSPRNSSLYDKMSNFAQGLASFYRRESSSSDERLSIKGEETDNTQYEIDLVESQDSQPDFEEIVHNLALKSSETYTTKLNRTQQKLIDFKDLYQNEQPDQPVINYDWKVQHEIILAQYTTIRLRFSSRQASKKQIESDIGVLGYIKRHHNQDSLSHKASSGNTDLHLKQIWDYSNSIFSE